MTPHALRRQTGSLTQGFVFCDGSEALPTRSLSPSVNSTLKLQMVPLSHSTSQVEESISSRSIKLKKAGASHVLEFYIVSEGTCGAIEPLLNCTIAVSSADSKKESKRRDAVFYITPVYNSGIKKETNPIF